MTNILKLPQLAWHGVRDLELPLPPHWKVDICNMVGYNRRALSPAEINAAIKQPIGSPPLRILAKNKKQVAIIFDDNQRGTRVAQIVPAILEELASAGIPDSNIRFVAATGCHAAMNRFDFINKLGEDVLTRFPVFNHNAFGSCVDIGTTSYGTRLQVNAEVMTCDLKIGIGSVVPHTMAGFGGGAKIILPGICHIDTCTAFHALAGKYQRENPDKPVGLGILENNLLRLNMDEAARMVGLDMKIDTVINSYGETVAVYAGKLESAYPAAIEDAKKHYDTVQSKENDVVIANAFAKVSESESGLEMAYPSVKQSGGEVVLIGNAPEGHVVHYLSGSWGKINHNKFKMSCAFPPHINRLINFTEYPDLTISGFFTDPDKVVVLSKWTNVLNLLQKSHTGSVRLAVYPNADIQYCSSNKGSKIVVFGAGCKTG